MAEKTNSYVVNKGIVEDTLFKTTIGLMGFRHYITEIDNMVEAEKSRNNFFTPTMEVMIQTFPELGDYLLGLYDDIIPEEEGKHIDKRTKLLQGALFDSILVGLNNEKGAEFGLYTANAFVINRVTDEESKVNYKNIAKMNAEGYLACVRLDVDYLKCDGDEYYTFKQTRVNKNTAPKLDTFDLVPFIFVYSFTTWLGAKMNNIPLDQLLSTGEGQPSGRRPIVEITENMGNITKSYLTTMNTNYLTRYNGGDEVFAESVKPRFFPLHGKIYLPTLGKGIFTSGLSSIKIIGIDGIRVSPNLSNRAVVREAGKSDMKGFIEDRIINSYFKELSHNEEEYLATLSKIKGFNIKWTDKSKVPAPYTVADFYKTTKDTNKERIKSLIPDFEERYNKTEGLFNKLEKVNISTRDELKALLGEHILKIMIRTKSTKASSLVVTNNHLLLAEVYGDNYEGIYESIGYRLRNAYNDVRDLPVDSRDILKDYDLSPDLLDALNNSLSYSEFYERATGKQERAKSSNTDLVLARSIFAYFDEEGNVKDYYKNIDINKIEYAAIIS